MVVQRGQRDKLDKYLDVNQEIEVVMNVAGTAVYDFTCFGLDGQGKLSNDAYMVFYNQVQSPNKEIRYQASTSGAQFFVNLSKLPESIQKLAFTVSIDGAGNMSMINSNVIQIKQNNLTILELTLSGTDFEKETAIISMEVYKKDVWRFAMVGNGCNGGLGDLLRNYGGEEAEDNVIQATPVQQQAKSTPMQSQCVPVQTQNVSIQQTQEQPAQSKVTKISLEKKLEQGAPKLVSLAKPLKVELEKRNLLDCVARVALVLDISGSMSGRYKNGTVQEIVNKTLPLAVQFDDDGELDFWYYGTTCQRMASVNMKNYESAVPADWKQLMRTLGGCNNEVLVMEEIVEEYTGTKLPVYVLFITDGGVSQAGKIKKILKEFSTEPVFWQFVGVGGKNYGVLEKLDTMEGRYVDNANFFALDDFKSVPNEELYGRLLEEFPQWLKEVREKGMVG